ncbi:MAG: DUF4003 family protein [Planctomycetota bacterium]|jgi:hypothetical protein|nr:DUF4003 family protein [Planctomycetota bacterium]MDP6740356.1 DUF4003 family protein [Planctomycetota bacterium]MDP6939794.1 DUF4003 family protein [Planctomycetota bacterium]
MQPTPFIPEDPLERFAQIESFAVPPRKWWRDGMIQRLSCMGLVTARGEPEEIASRFEHTADELKRSAGWFGALNSSVRFAVAATLVRREQSAGSFAVELDRVQRMMREERLPRGGMREVVAILLLSGAQQDKETPRSSVEHLGGFFRAMKSRKRMLTGVDDYPACVLLCRTDVEAEAILDRVDGLYDGLRKAGFWRGNALQTASHFLYFCPLEDELAAACFADLFGEFKRAGLRMNQRDYALVATLAFLDVTPERIVECVLDHRRELLAHTGARGKEEGFRLAVMTAFQELAAHGEQSTWAADTSRLLGVVDLIAAQQAAVVVAATSASAGAAASS